MGPSQSPLVHLLPYVLTPGPKAHHTHLPGVIDIPLTFPEGEQLIWTLMGLCWLHDQTGLWVNDGDDLGEGIYSHLSVS